MALSGSLRRLIKNGLKLEENFHVNKEHLSPAELQFVERARARNGGIVHRPSWPDFLVMLNGELIGVEVKSIGDRVSRNQRRTFNLLQDNGIMKIFIWYTGTPDRLIPWKRAKNPLIARHVEK